MTEESRCVVHGSLRHKPEDIIGALSITPVFPRKEVLTFAWAVLDENFSKRKKYLICSFQHRQWYEPRTAPTCGNYGTPRRWPLRARCAPIRHNPTELRSGIYGG
jgi:hypothetical protein